MTLTSRFAQQPAPTPEQVLAKAEAMVPRLVELQADTEQRTYYSEAIHEEFRAAGFYRLLVPKRYGGYEMGLETFFRVVMTLTRGCPSTGWMYCLGAAHSLVTATLFDERAQDEVFAGGDFIAPAVVAPGGTAERGDGGWIVNGTWSYCSGVPYATHFIGHALVTGDDSEQTPMLFIAPRDQWCMLDDWGKHLGLRGSGSHSVVFKDGWVPDHLTLPMHLGEATVTSGTPGLALHRNPLYGGAPLSSMCIEGASLGVGIAQGALDAYADVLRVRKTSVPPIVRMADHPDYQRWYGQAVGLIAAAEAATLGAVAQWDALCAKGSAAFTVEEDLRIAMICKEAADLAWRAVDDVIFPTAGSSALRSGGRLERLWRDMSTAHTHTGFTIQLPLAASRELAKFHLGDADQGSLPKSA